MKAITLHQPWATLMAIGAKRIETRSWPTRYRGPLAIHAAKAFPAYAKDLCYAGAIRRLLGWPDHDGRVNQVWLDDINARIKALPLGAIVGTCRLVHCLDTDLIPRFVSPFTEQEKLLGNYESGRFGWLTEDMKRIDPPIPAIGALGLWDWHCPEVCG